MAVGINAASFMGIAFESSYGVYTAPTEFFPITGESLHHVQQTRFRRPILGVADIYGTVPGNVRIEGDISLEVIPEAIVYFLYASRNSIAKSGATPNFVYTTTPTHVATVAASRSLSVTVVRNGVVFGYTGCSVVKQSYTVDDAVLMGTMSIIGSDEAVQSAPVPTWPTTVPFGAGEWTIEIPTGTAVEDTDTFTFEVDDTGEAAYRLRTSRGAKFVKFGERTVTLSVERDFENRTEYDAYKALTAQSITVKAAKSATRYVNFKTPAAVKDEYTVQATANQGDLVRASIRNMGIYDLSSTKSYEIAVGTAEDIT